MKKIIVILVLLLIGCGKSTEDKNLFSAWTLQGSTFVLNLTGQSFGTGTMTLVLTNGITCTSTAELSGAQSSGTYSISNSTGSAGCSALNSSGTFTKTSDTLTFCATSTGLCDIYK